ncbi:hypothetical protein [Stenotrophomonas sp. YAU14D1_LEIMI4_1]|uniref:hypothetical protein n=1 Tax=Stenotrophomonas sp. YAU14D1_LEIMI4_1 TaxID=2072407 RepID=UPI000D53D119|nr:hypothetical protein [Stenotrophomonas sp. YAU14D1_LEIMI4_1]AWH25722.1 hypothetical protein C1932_11815 [Stenotrophomonas sp. YAU14D1_LEIMI4_1]
MYQLTENPDIIRCVETGADIPRGHRWWSDYEEWLAEGNEPAQIELVGPAPHSPEHYRAIRDAAFAWMSSTVVARGYETIESCASYYNSGVERYRLEARALVAWRDDVNQTLEQLVLDPPPGVITWDQVRALLPQPEAYPWPGTVELPLSAEAAPPVAIS